MQNVTLAYIMDRIESEYGRMTPKIKARLTSDINGWIALACKRWPFWFLESEPGLVPMSLFPVSDVTTLTRVYGYWWDKGWLVTDPGVYAYTIAYPFQPGIIGIPEADISHPTATAQTQQQNVRTDLFEAYQQDGWSAVDIQQLLYVKKFRLTGTIDQDLDIFPYSDFTRRSKLDASGEPICCTFNTINGISQLIFNCVPDNNYIYQVGFRLGSLPPLDRPDATNLFAINYPEVLITVGIIKAAKYFGEKTEVAAYTVDLYGESYAKERNPDMTPGGMIGDILAEGRKRHTPRDRVLKVYTSSRKALAKRGSRRKWIPGGYYWDGSP